MTRRTKEPPHRLRLSTRRVTLTLADADPGLIEVSSPTRAALVARGTIGEEAVEVILAILLDSRNRVIGCHEIARGTLNASRLKARDVFVAALYANAQSVVVAHNHPSGEAEFSNPDRRVCETLIEAGRLLGIAVNDFLVVTPTTHRSMRDWRPDLFADTL